MVKIYLNNVKSKIDAPAKVIIQLRKSKTLSYRVKGAFFTPAFRRGNWDGWVKFVSETGRILTGKVPDVIRFLVKEDIKFKIIDERPVIIKPKKLSKRLNNRFKLRDYQGEALMAVFKNKLYDKIPFPRGIIFGATNFGKTITSAGFHIIYQQPTLFLINSKVLLKQAIEEMPDFIPKEDIGILASGYELEWKPFMIVMVPTAYSRIQSIKNQLASYPVLLVDECDLATSKSYKTVINYAYNAYVKIGLSGSALVDKRKKEKNEQVTSIFGPIIHKVKNRELMDKGYSAEVKVHIIEGNTKVRVEKGYDEEYKKGITLSNERNTKILKRALFHSNRGRLPLLIMVKYHKHVDRLMKMIKLKEERFDGLTVDWVHHKRKDREEVIKRFKEGKIDILVGTYILKRGKNLPLMKALINAGGGDSFENVLQILGRLTRTHESKDYTWLDDFYDYGKYLQKHSKHRIIVDKNEKLEITDEYKQ